MLIFLALFCLVQEPAPQPAADGKVTNNFQPYPPGTEVRLGSFSITVPDGTFYAGEENAHFMFPLAGADFIPDCVGIFFSNENDWDFCLVVQHYPYQPFTLAPRPPDSSLVDRFTSQHLYRMQPFEGEAAVFEAPSYNDSEGTFSIAMRYVDKDEQWNVSGIYKKKIWVTAQDALVISLRSSEQGYSAHEAPIEAAFQSVTSRSDNGEALIGAQPTSYLQLLGVTPQPFLSPDQASLSPGIILTSVGLIIFATALLLFALKKMKQAKKAA